MPKYSVGERVFWLDRRDDRKETVWKVTIVKICPRRVRVIRGHSDTTPEDGFSFLILYKYIFKENPFLQPDPVRDGTVGSLKKEDI